MKREGRRSIYNKEGREEEYIIKREGRRSI